MPLIDSILSMIFAEPLVPYVELVIIYVLIKLIYNKWFKGKIFKDKFDRKVIKKDIEELKKVIN